MISAIEDKDSSLLPGESGPRRSTAGASLPQDSRGQGYGAAGESEGYTPPSENGAVAAAHPSEAAAAAGGTTVSIDGFAHRVADEFRWFAFNQPLRGDHFGITKLLLDRRYRERAFFRSKELDGGGDERGGGSGGGSSPSHEEWLEYVRENPDVGLFTIAYMHDGPRSFVKYYVKLLLYLILGAQLLIPFLFWLYRTTIRDLLEGDVCPASAPVPSRMISTCVALIYFTKINFLTMEKLVRSSRGVGSSALNETDRGGRLQVHVALDRHMDLVYKAVVYIINLKIVFLEDNAIEILLNALAMEFVLMLDGEVKGLYMRVFEVDVYAYRLANNENGDAPIPRWEFNLVVLFSYYNWGALWICLTVLSLFLIYLPVCKV